MQVRVKTGRAREAAPGVRHRVLIAAAVAAVLKERFRIVSIRECAAPERRGWRRPEILRAPAPPRTPQTANKARVKPPRKDKAR
jgi:hypothetical protein